MIVQKSLKFNFLIAVLLLSIPAFAQKAKIQVYPDLKKQIIQSIGGNYCKANNWEELKNIGKIKRGTMLVKLKSESVNTFIIK